MNCFQVQRSFHAATYWCTYRNEETQTHSFLSISDSLIMLMYNAPLVVTTLPSTLLSFLLYYLMYAEYFINNWTCHIKSTLIIPNTFHLCPTLIFKQYWTQYYHVMQAILLGMTGLSVQSLPVPGYGLDYQIMHIYFWQGQDDMLRQAHCCYGSPPKFKCFFNFLKMSHVVSLL
jgi:hypothetical protein